jgi:hypothetical protein
MAWITLYANDPAFFGRDEHTALAMACLTYGPDYVLHHLFLRSHRGMGIIWVSSEKNKLARGF